MERSFRTNYLISAVPELLLGLILMLWPENSRRFLCIAAGILLMAAGICVLIYTWNTERSLLYSTGYLKALLLVLTGLLFLLRSAQIIELFMTFMGLILIAENVIKLQIALQMRRSGVPSHKAYAIVAAVLLALGIAFLFDPFSGAKFVTVAVGVILFLDACCSVWAVIAVRENENGGSIEIR